jgi:hypothetical protein
MQISVVNFVVGLWRVCNINIFRLDIAVAVLYRIFSLLKTTVFISTVGTDTDQYCVSVTFVCLVPSGHRRQYLVIKTLELDPDGYSA